jgi:hypothetical protein
MMSDITYYRAIILFVYIFMSVVFDLMFNKKYPMGQAVLMEKRAIDFVSYIACMLMYRNGELWLNLIGCGVALICKLSTALTYVKFAYSRQLRIILSIVYVAFLLFISYMVIKYLVI